MQKCLGIIVFMLLGSILSADSFAQSSRVYKYAVFFKDKDTVNHRLSAPETFLSERAITRKSKSGIAITLSDLPVSSVNLQSLSATGALIHNTSRWFNCAIVFLSNPRQADSIRRLPFVKEVIDVGFSIPGKKRTSTINLREMVSLLEKKFTRKQQQYQSDGNSYGAGFAQANAHGIPALHAQGLTGRGVLVAVVDAGFRNATDIPLFLHALRNTVATYDVVDMEENVFDDDDHGTAVWSCMSAMDSFNFIGTAPDASFLLLRSEDAVTEFPVEEFYWAIAAEFADSAGADVLSTSLGYNEFGSTTYNYAQRQLNGRSAWISKAASLAVAKGMFVVCSAGNEGTAKWKLITFPADVREALTVAAVNKEFQHAGFSSVGYVNDDCVKPDVVAIGERAAVVSDAGVVYEGDGTSYACPVLAGGIVCLWPLLNQLPSNQLIELIHLSSGQYHHPDKQLGYGVPDLLLLQKMLQPYQHDSILDVRQFNDGSVHLTISVDAPKKLAVKLADSNGKEVYSRTFNLRRKGVQRQELEKMHPMDAGEYRLFITTQNVTHQQTLVLKK